VAGVQWSHGRIHRSPRGQVQGRDAGAPEYSADARQRYTAQACAEGEEDHEVLKGQTAHSTLAARTLAGVDVRSVCPVFVTALAASQYIHILQMVSAALFRPANNFLTVRIRIADDRRTLGTTIVAVKSGCCYVDNRE